jgi:outer membrane protein assembly factor BamB
MNRRRFLRQTAGASAAALLVGCASKEQRPAEPAPERTPPAGNPPPATPVAVEAPTPAKEPSPAPAAPTDAGELDGDFPAWNLGDESASTNTMLMFRGNPTHTFYGTGPIPDKPKLLWKQKLGQFHGVKADGTEQDWSGTGWSGHPVRWGNRVFVGAVDTHFYCFNAKTGDVIWKFDGGRMFKGSCCFYKGHLYMGNVDNNLRCIDGKTGKVKWKYDTKRDLDSSPCVSGGRLYIGGEDGKLKCFDPETGKPHWIVELGEGKGSPPGSGGIESSPAVADGEVYVGHYDGYLLCADAATGKEKWRAQTGGDSDVSPVVVGERIYAGSEPGEGDGAWLRCFDRSKKGKLVWEFNNKRGWWSTPAVIGNRLWVGGDDGIMYCLHADSGKVIWTYKVGKGIWSSPNVVDGKVLFGSYDPNYYMLDADKGKLIWSYPMGQRTHSTSCIVGGHIYVGSANGYFHCFG